MKVGEFIKSLSQYSNDLDLDFYVIDESGERFIIDAINGDYNADNDRVEVAMVPEQEFHKTRRLIDLEEIREEIACSVTEILSQYLEG